MGSSDWIQWPASHAPTMISLHCPPNLTHDSLFFFFLPPQMENINNESLRTQAMLRQKPNSKNGAPILNIGCLSFAVHNVFSGLIGC